MGGKLGSVALTEAHNLQEFPEKSAKEKILTSEGKQQHKDEEKSIMFVLYEKIRRKIKQCEMGRTCSTHVTEARFMQGFHR